MTTPESLRHFYALLSRGLLARAEEFLADHPADGLWCEARANLLEMSGHSQSAEEWYRRAPRPDQASWHSGLARCLQNQDRWEESLEHFRQAEALSGADTFSRWARLAQAEVLLASGRWAEGWQAYEARFEVDGISRQDYFSRCLADYSPPFLQKGQPEWQGQDFSGQTLLVWKEQGDGDCFQFLRLLKLARSRGSRLVFACPCPLVRLLQGVEGVDLASQKLPPELAPVEFDYQIPLLSLARVLGITPENLPPPECLSRPTRQPRVPGDPLKVGLVWAGQRLSLPERRSLALAALAPLSEIPGVRFYSLQKGADSIQAAWPPPGLQLEDLSGGLHDWAETASVLGRLDLLISIDTGVAHLAGVVGCPTWLLLCHRPDWRWLEPGRNSRWYPKHRIYKQPQPGDWQSCIQALKEDLWQLSRSTEN